MTGSFVDEGLAVPHLVLGPRTLPPGLVWPPVAAR